MVKVVMMVDVALVILEAVMAMVDGGVNDVECNGGGSGGDSGSRSDGDAVIAILLMVVIAITMAMGMEMMVVVILIMVGYAHIGQGAYEKPLCHLLNFVVNLKLFLKKKVFKVYERESQCLHYYI